MATFDPTVTAAPARRSTWQTIGRALDRAITFLSVAGAVAAGLAAVIMVVLIVVEVVGRSVFSHSTLLADEYSGYLLVAMAFLGLAYTAQGSAHIRADSLLRLLPPRVQEWLIIIGLVLSLLFIIILTAQVAILINLAYTFQERAITVQRTPLFIPQLLMPIGLVLFGLNVAREIVKRVIGCQSPPVSRNPEDPDLRTL